MIIRLNNLKGGDLSLDLLVTRDIPPIRVLIPQGGFANVGDLVSLDELNLSEDLKTLVGAGDLSITVVGDSDDLSEVIAGTILGVPQLTAASESIPMGTAKKSGTIISAQAASIVITGDATEELSIDILKNGSTILTAAIVIDDSSTARTVVAGALDPAEIQVVAGDFLEAVLTYTAGTPAPISGTVIEVEIIPA